MLCIQFLQLFALQEPEQEGAVSGGKLPVKLEICSGFGEWVIEQAKAEAGVANWSALELRYDRCHSIFSRMVFEAVRCALCKPE